MESSSFPGFTKHLAKITKLYGKCFKDDEQLRYFAMLPIADRQRTELFNRMVKCSEDEKALKKTKGAMLDELLQKVDTFDIKT